MAIVQIRMRQAAITDFLHSPAGPIHQAVASRTRKTDAISAATCPKDTGRMVNDRVSGVRDEGTRLVGFVQYLVYYAIYRIKGTGIYGPRGRPITPKSAKVLVFRGADGNLVYAKSVKGTRPSPFLVDALKAGAGGWPVDEH